MYAENEQSPRPRQKLLPQLPAEKDIVGLEVYVSKCSLQEPHLPEDTMACVCPWVGSVVRIQKRKSVGLKTNQFYAQAEGRTMILIQAEFNILQ